MREEISGVLKPEREVNICMIAYTIHRGEFLYGIKYQKDLQYIGVISKLLNQQSICINKNSVKHFLMSVEIL